MSNIIEIRTTVPDIETAELIGRELILNTLAASVQVSGPIKSHFHWKGKIHQREEYLCSIKTMNHLYRKVDSTIRKLHPYELPEIFSIKITQCSDDYQNWVQSNIVDKQI